MAVHRAKKTPSKANAKKGAGKKIVEPNSPLSDEAMEKLARIMNDSPTIVKLQGTEWQIHALKPGTQWLIAEEACKIVKGENMSMGDVIKEFATNLPSVAKVITLALLNDKERIEKDYQKVYETIMWESEMKDWGTLLVQVLELIDVGFFFQITESTQMFRQMSLARKTTMEEAKKLSG